MATLPLNILDYQDYKDCLRGMLLGNDSSQSALARAIQCQPAYLNRVLLTDAHLSFEQMEAACRYFLLSVAETSFLIALLGENRAGTRDLKSYWQKQMKDAREQAKNIRSRLELDDTLSESDVLTYYGSWQYAAIHVATSIPTLQTIKDLSAHFSLSEANVRSVLDFLLRKGLVEKKDSRYEMSMRTIHLDKKSPMVAKHHVNWKLKSIESMNVPDDQALRYTGLISISRADAEKIRELILQSIEKARKITRDSGEEILGCYSFEYFEVGGRSH